MSNFFVIHTSHKISLVIFKKAFEDIVNSLPNVISGIKVDVSKTNIEISETGKNFRIFLDIKVSKNEKISEKIKEIKNKIEIHCLYLIDSKPKNIIINYLGTY